MLNPETGRGFVKRDGIIDM